MYSLDPRELIFRDVYRCLFRDFFLPTVKDSKSNLQLETIATQTETKTFGLKKSVSFAQDTEPNESEQNMDKSSTPLPPKDAPELLAWSSDPRRRPSVEPEKIALVHRKPSQTITTDLSPIQSGNTSLQRSSSIVSTCSLKSKSKFKTLRLYFYGRDLGNSGHIGVIDPYVLVKTIRHDKNEAKNFRTETIKNRTNPHWTTPVDIRYLSESETLEFIIYDEDIGKKDSVVNRISDVKISELLGEKGVNPLGYKPLRLTKGVLFVQALTDRDFKHDLIRITARAENLPKMDTFGKCDPFFEVIVYEGLETALKLYTSPVKKKTFNPQWDLIEIPKKRIFYSNESKARMIVKMYDYDKLSKPELVGKTDFFQFDLDAPLTLNLTNKGKNRGTLIFSQTTLQRSLVKNNSLLSISSEGDVNVLQLFFCAKNLPANERSKQSNYIQVFSETECVQIDEEGKTEVLNSANPEWLKPVTLIYRRKTDVIKIMVCDESIQSSTDELEISIEEIKNGQTNGYGYVEKELKEGGELWVMLVGDSDLRNPEKFIFSAVKIPKMDIFGKCDPYFQIFVVDQENDEDIQNPLKIYKSKIIKKSLSPKVCYRNCAL